MKDEVRRTVIALAVFAVIFWGSPALLGSHAYHETVRAIEFLSAVVGAGCYWAGSGK